MIDKLMIRLYEALHRKYSARTMTWHTLTVGVGDKVVKLRIYGPKGMRMTDVAFEQMPGRVNWYKLRKDDESGQERS